jgi:hypothetical protein
MKSFVQVAMLSLLGLLMLSAFTMPLLVKPAKATTTPPITLTQADLNQDGNLTLADLVGFAKVFGMTNQSSLWNQPIEPTGNWTNASAADFNNDGKINLADLVTLAIAFSIYK